MRIIPDVRKLFFVIIVNNGILHSEIFVREFV